MERWKTDEEWAEFGKQIYDTAMKLFVDKPIQSAVIPLKLEDTSIAKVIISEPAMFVKTETEYNDDGTSKTVFYHSYRFSDGRFEWVRR